MKKSNEQFLIETLQELIEAVGFDFVPQNPDIFENIANYMYTRSLMADLHSTNMYDRVVRLLFAVNFLPRSKALQRFTVHSHEFWDEIDKTPIDFPTDKFVHPKGAAPLHHTGQLLTETFKLHGYSYDNLCCVQEGDTVIDCGGYIGDVSLYFWDKMNKHGKIYVFEPMPSLFENIKDNVRAFSAENVVIPINKGTGNTEGKLRFSSPNNSLSSSRIDPDGGIEADITTIDLFAEREGLSSVDFIKMDIEGAELLALQGAEHVIKKFRPKMAICIYHKREHHWEIPQLILSYDSNYQFYIKHGSKHTGETVLFCVPSQIPPPLSAATYSAIVELYKSTHFQLRHRNNMLSINQIINEIDKKGLMLEWVVPTGKIDRKRLFITNIGNNYVDIAHWKESLHLEIRLNDTSFCDNDTISHIKNLFKKIKKKFPGFIVQHTETGGAYQIPWQTGYDQTGAIAAVFIKIIQLVFSELDKIGMLSATIDDELFNMNGINKYELVNKLEADLKNETAQKDAAYANYSVAQEKMKGMTAEIKRLKKLEMDLTSHVNYLVESYSWKITKPLRSLRGLFSKQHKKE